MQMDDVSREDLLFLLACFQSELEARETVIKTLKCGKTSCSSLAEDHNSQLVCEPRPSSYGNPYHALYRDSLIVPNSSDGDAALKPLYDSQLIQLENLITTQRCAQDKMRNQIILVEEKYLKACEALEEQRKKHERDTAQGDDVLVLVEKEREKLKTELEHERLQNKRLEKELKTLQTSWCEQRILLQKHRQAGVCLWKERRSLLNRLTRAQERITELEKQLECYNSGLDCKLPTLAIVDQSGCSLNSEDGAIVEKNIGVDCTVTSEPCRCEDLHSRLNEEETSRLLVEEKHERLQRKYEALLAETNRLSHMEPDTSVSLEGDATPGVTKLRNDSPPRFQRFKPDPPARRSSEISSSASGCITGCSGIDGLCNETQPEATQLISEPTTLHKRELGAPKITGFGCDTTISLGAKMASLSTESSSASELSESRSSTPSPPPPPPPIHLHYPYPGMQSQLHHSLSLRGSSEATPYLCSPPSDRPLSGPPTHSNSGPKVRGLLNPHLPHQSFTHYQPSYPSSSALQGTRIQKLRVVTGRRSAPRKPVTVAIPQSASPPALYHSHYPSFSSIQANQQSSQFPPSQFIRSSVGLNPNNHHIHAYSPTRPHTPVPTVNPLNSSARLSRPVPPSAAGLASGTIPINTGHVCINGK